MTLARITLDNKEIDRGTLQELLVDGKLDVLQADMVRNYLDTAITFWRVNLHAATERDEIRMAQHYIDAYQSARVAIIGGRLAEDHG